MYNTANRFVITFLYMSFKNTCLIEGPSQNPNPLRNNSIMSRLRMITERKSPICKISSKILCCCKSNNNLFCWKSNQLSSALQTTLKEGGCRFSSNKIHKFFANCVHSTSCSSTSLKRNLKWIQLNVITMSEILDDDHEDKYWISVSAQDPLPPAALRSVAARRGTAGGASTFRPPALLYLSF